jgi:CRISPR-associated protein Csm1
MKVDENREIIIITIAGLLHDIGKFYQRGLKNRREDHQKLGDECFEQYFAEKLSLIFSQEEIQIIRSAINNHHEHVEEYITRADWISAGMERIEKIKLEDEEHGDPSKESLRSIFENISLTYNYKKTNEYAYPLKPLSIEKKEVLFPVKFEKQDLTREYKNLWDEFVKAVRGIPTVHPRSFLNALYAILQKYTWCVPSAVYKDEPDISLFDHAKTTAAIAGCLYYSKKAGENINNKFVIVGGDISGIQNFIYKIAKAQGESGIAKRLRGRSFYLVLFQEVIVKYIVEKAGLFIPNILFCSGGRFELLLPNTKRIKELIEEVGKDVNKWLFKEHGGELGLILEVVETNEGGLASYDNLLNELDEKLSKAKKRKFISSFNNTEFFIEDIGKGDFLKICKVCGINRIPDENQPCELCKIHKDIGSILPRVKYLIFAKKALKDVNGVSVSFDKFGTVDMMPEEIKENELATEDILDIQKINNLNDLNFFTFYHNNF